MSEEQKVKTGKDLKLDVGASSGIRDGDTRPWSIEERRRYRIFGVDYARTAISLQKSRLSEPGTKTNHPSRLSLVREHWKSSINI